MQSKLLIMGQGRMGTCLAETAKRTGYDFVASVSAKKWATGEYSMDQVTDIHRAEVVVDFSCPLITPHLARLCVAFPRPLVIGTTGLTDEVKAEINRTATAVPIVLASNFSTGVNTLFWLTRKAVEILGPSFDLEVVEMHHRHKKDAPSGTAKTLIEILSAVRKKQTGTNTLILNGRHGDTGKRTDFEIGVHAVRGGGVVGDHTVIFASGGERVELVHRAISRETFAEGALCAAEWVVGQPPGLYDMQNVLGFR